MDNTKQGCHEQATQVVYSYWSCTNRCLYYFPIAAVTNELKTTSHKLLPYCSGGQKTNTGFTVLKPRGWQLCVPSESSFEERIYFFSFLNFLRLLVFLGLWPRSPSQKSAV